VLGLVERGHSLVSDDITRFRALEGPGAGRHFADLTRHHMEIRGLGVINVMSIFGIGSVRLEKRLD
jgi:HPr kinase/phosphorylase